MKDKEKNEIVAIKYIERGRPASLLYQLLIMSVSFPYLFLELNFAVLL